jgi:hypothetical protein
MLFTEASLSASEVSDTVDRVHLRLRGKEESLEAAALSFSKGGILVSGKPTIFTSIPVSVWALLIAAQICGNTCGYHPLFVQ